MYREESYSHRSKNQASFDVINCFYLSYSELPRSHWSSQVPSQGLSHYLSVSPATMVFLRVQQPRGYVLSRILAGKGGQSLLVSLLFLAIGLDGKAYCTGL